MTSHKDDQGATELVLGSDEMSSLGPRQGQGFKMKGWGGDTEAPTCFSLDSRACS
jgi:hypothetical protein